MSNTLWDDKALTRLELDRFVFEVDQKISIEHKKEFVDVVVFMPMIFAFQNADPHHRVIHFAKRLIVPLVLARIDQLLNVNQLQRPVQNIQVSLVRKIFRFVYGHDVDLSTNCLGSARALACTVRRLAEQNFLSENYFNEVRDCEGAIASTRGACAPQNHSSPSK
jgi:hypothetical protein